MEKGGERGFMKEKLKEKMEKDALCGGGKPDGNYSIEAHAIINRFTKPEGTMFPVYQCTQCLFCFGNRSSLVDHMPHHEGEESTFSCYFCLAPFESKDELMEHIVYHAGPTPFECRLCEKVFRSKSGFCSHINKQHAKKKAKIDTEEASPSQKKKSKRSSTTGRVKPVRLAVKKAEDGDADYQVVKSEDDEPDSESVKKEEDAEIYQVDSDSDKGQGGSDDDTASMNSGEGHSDTLLCSELNQ
jgi:uncharacterized C2H2 Zn-finger protein